MNSKLFRQSGLNVLLAFSLVGASWGKDFFFSPIDDSAPTPQPPFLKQPDAIAYNAAFAYQESTPAATTPEQLEKLNAMKLANPRLMSITVEKVGDLRHDVRQWDAGEPSEVDLWYTQTAAFMEGTDAFGKPNGIHSEPAFAKGAEAFPELKWVGKLNFAGAIQDGKRTIDVYRHKFTGLNAGGFNPIYFQNEEVTAYIDDETRLPLALKAGRFSVVYSYRTAPLSLDPPAKYLKAFKTYKYNAEHPDR